MLTELDLAYALISAQRALLGAVAPSLRAVTLDLDTKKKHLTVCFFYDGEINDELFELASCAITEIIADFTPDFSLDDQIVRLDYPQKIPVQGRLVYNRKE